MSQDYELACEIVHHIGIVAENGNNWHVELNKVIWKKSDNTVKYDIRRWKKDHTKIGKGISLTEDEFLNLINLFNSSITEKPQIKLPADKIKDLFS